MEKAQVQMQNNRPALLIDGQERPPILYGLSDIPASNSNTAQAQRNIANFARQGITMVTADTGLHLGWHRTTDYETAPMIAEVEGVLEANPDALILLRLHLNPPYWWMREHPEECVLYNGEPGIDDGDQLRLIRNDHRKHIRVSLASELWMKEAGEKLEQFCRECADTEAGRHVMGIQVACGVNGEWHQWGEDTGPAMEKRFRRYLKETYGTDEALQKAWGDDTVTLETAHFCPTVSRPGDDGIFRDPVLARDTMDAQRCIQISVPEAILYFCRIVKACWPRPILAGSFYGYYLGTGGANAPIGGHLFPEMLFAHKEAVDMLCGPFPYMQNRRANGTPMSRGLMESQRLNHTLWLTEMDQHPIGCQQFFGFDPAYWDETVSVLRRNVLLPQLGGMGLWYYDHRIVPGAMKLDGYPATEDSIFLKKGWWEHPDLLKEIRALYKLSEKHMEKPFQPAADVLVVYDSKAAFAITRPIPGEYPLHDALGHSGAAYDCIYLSDLDKAEMARYRCVIFPNAVCLSPEQRKEILRLTEGKHVIWLYAPGYSDGRTLSPDQIRELTGLSVEKTQTAHGYTTLSPLPESDMTWEEDLTPLFAVADESAQPLARYTDSGAVCAARKGNTWYFAAPFIGTDVLRFILAQAGAHLYCVSNDVVLADGAWVALNTASGGEKKLTLKNGREIACTLKPMTTAVFDAESGERLL